MKRNVGPTDKIIRIILAVILVGVYLLELVPAPYDIALLVIAGIMVLVSVINFCPLYAPFGIKTCPKNKK